MDVLSDIFDLQKKVLQHQTKYNGGSLSMLMNMIPTVVVIGGQSTGKSSLVEALVGTSLLPKGFGIVTKRPLFIEVVPCDRLSFAVDGISFSTSDGVKNQISTLMNLKESEFVSDEPIYITVYSPSGNMISMIDLPGLTKIQMKDQPKDIVKKLTAIARRYTTPSNHIILATSAANADLATSDALTCAKVVDPDGNRTIGVLCKCDLAEEGQDLTRILNNEVHPLKHGFYGVINTGEGNENSDTYPGSQKEMELFNSSKYKNLKNKNNLGVTNLRNKIVSIILNTLKKQLPNMSDELIKIRTRLEAAIVKIEPLTNKSDASMLLLLINNFYATINDMVRGQHLEILNMNILEGGAKLRQIFVDDFRRNLRSIAIMNDIRDEDILMIVRNAAGTSGTLFLSSQAFEFLVRNEIPKFAPPAFSCLEELFSEMNSLVILSLEAITDMAMYPKLAEAILDESKKFLETCMIPTKDMISNLIEIESSFIDLTVQLERSSKESSPNASQLTGLNPATFCKSPIWTEAVKVRFIKELAMEYLENTRRSLGSSIPKAIVRFFISEFLGKIQTWLVESLHSNRTKYLEKSEGTMKELSRYKDELTFINDTSKIVQGIKYRLLRIP